MIHKFKTKDQLSQYFSEMLHRGISETLEGEYYTMALSGGSTPRAIFEYLAVHYKDTINWDKLLVFWGDERCVAPDDDDSNFKMASDSLLDKVPIPKKNIFRIKGENDPADEAKCYAQAISENVKSHEGLPQFDLVMLGLGTDGHTASIFPGCQHLFDYEKICEVVQHPQSLQTRITITGKTINQAKIVTFLVTGESKATMAATIIEQQEGWEDFPASKVKPV